MVENYGEELRRATKAFDSKKSLIAFKEQALQEAREELVGLEKLALDSEKARLVVQKVARKVQTNLEARLEKIVTTALAAVFPDPYEFKTRFVERRNQTECDMLFVKRGNECDPMSSSGGGAKDIASMALRMAVWSINQTRAVQILDEPAKFLSRDLQEACSEILKRLSDDLGIQLIIVSHIPEMIASADRVFHLEQNDEGVAKVTTIR